MATQANRTLLDRVVNSVMRRAKDKLAQAKVRFSMKHLHGPRRIVLNDNACGLVSMMKNAEYYIDEFIRHHQSLGVSHILLIDNGSTDATVSRAASYENISIVQNTLPPSIYESRLRRQSARKYFQGGWLLFMDSDELFNLPSSHPEALTTAIDYCNESGFTAVACQCLDLFSKLPLDRTAQKSYADSLQLFTQYSLGAMDRHKICGKSHPFTYFTTQCKCSSEVIFLHFGGIRASFFGEDCLLTAFRLVKNLDTIGIYEHPHFSTNVIIADFSALIRHYKFCGDVIERERRQLEQKIWAHGQDKKRAAVFSRKPDLVIQAEDQKTLDRVEELVDQEFLVITDRLRGKLDQKGRGVASAQPVAETQP